MLSNLEEYKKYMAFWPLLTFIVVLLGYIGFYSYSVQFGISYVVPDISVIIGIGLYNLIVILILYFPIRLKEPTYSSSLVRFGYINFLSINPIMIGLLILINIQFWSFKDSFFKKRNKKKNISRVGIVYKAHRLKLICEILSVIFILIMTLFLNKSLFFMSVVIHFGAIGFHLARKSKKLKKVEIAIIALMVPIITSTYFLKNIDYTVIGLSKEQVEIHLKDETKINGLITYKSNDNLYITVDSTNLVIPYERVNEIVKTELERSSESGLEYILQLINNKP